LEPPLGVMPEPLPEPVPVAMAPPDPPPPHAANVIEMAAESRSARPRRKGLSNVFIYMSPVEVEFARRSPAGGLSFHSLHA
jgi:hypothetical protein